MRILFITTYFAPDNAIPAKRLSMFAKYLSLAGHEVTVIRKGSMWSIGYPPDWCQKYGIKVLSYMGGNSQADYYEKNGVLSNPADAANDAALSPLAKIKKKILRENILGIKTFKEKYLEKYLRCIDTFKQHMKTIFREKKMIMRCIDKNLSGETFDVVFASYGDLPNPLAGLYASKKFACPFVLDFRDLMYPNIINYWWLKYYFCLLQKKCVKHAAFCTTVSEGEKNNLYAATKSENIRVVYNGYEENGEEIQEKKCDHILRFCYTGVMYKKRKVGMLLTALQQLSDEQKIDLKNIVIEYAGSHFDAFLQEAKKYKMDSLLVNHGIVSKAQVMQLQQDSDLFLVLSWNTKNEQGILTGKFYEAIQNRLPVLALISGTLPESELKQLIAKYRLGFTYEEAADQRDYTALCDYIKMQYDRKMSGLPLEYAPDPDVFKHFNYEHLTRQLENILQDAVSSSK